MTLNLAIENMDRLPDGGPVRFQARGRGLDIGRDAHLDWTLPDPDRHVSSKHCEIRFRDGGYWLTDVSTNGTFLNGSTQRLPAPTKLKDKDRLTIGRYIVAVALEGEAAPAPSPFAAQPMAAAAPQRSADIWGGGEAAPPESRAAFRPNPPARAQADFLDFAAPMASLAPAPSAFAAPPPPAHDPWMNAAPAPPPPLSPAAPPPVAPTPRRPTYNFDAAPAAPEPEPASSAPMPAAFAAPMPAPSPATPREPDPPARPQPSLQVSVQVSAPAAPGGAPDLLARILASAGVAAPGVASRDPGQLADDIGAFMSLTARHLAELLASRAETKSLIRSSSRTEIRALENNPLRFQATPAEALAIMLGPPHRSYLGSSPALERTFADLKEHQVLTFGAMQGALEALFEDLAPEKLEKSLEPDKGLGSLLASRKAKLWDLYVERWRAKTKRSDGKLNEAFTALFGQAYDKLLEKRGP